VKPPSILTFTEFAQTCNRAESVGAPPPGLRISIRLDSIHSASPPVLNLAVDLAGSSPHRFACPISDQPERPLSHRHGSHSTNTRIFRYCGICSACVRPAGVHWSPEGATFETWTAAPMAHGFHCYCDGPTKSRCDGFGVSGNVSLAIQRFRGCGLSRGPTRPAAADVPGIVGTDLAYSWSRKRLAT